jgi:hypothetical protein
MRKITPKGFRELSVEFPELFAREKEQERSEATDVDTIIRRGAPQAPPTFPV